MEAADLDIAARTLLGEVRGESLDGQRAVAWVIKNRAARGAKTLARTGKPHVLFGDGSLRSACLAPKQFSCWNEGDPNLKVIKNWSSAKAPYAALYSLMAEVMLSPDDPTTGATHYFTAAKPSYAASWPPGWVKSMLFCGRFGAHVFYKEP